MTDRPYSLVPGQPLQVEVVQPDGSRALIVGVLEAVPVSGGSQALRLRVRASEIRPMEAE